MSKIYFRANVSHGIKEGTSGIDRENGVVKGFAVISKGEAKGHGLQIDDTMLNQVVELGNKSNIGIKSRFGHPNMSSEALGTYLGRVKNFSRDGDIVRADLILDKSSFNTPNGDLATYVLNLAESDPDAFGSSIVFSGKPEELKNDSGEIQKDASGSVIILARCEKLYAADIVDEPAANSGFFSESVKFSSEMTQFLEKLLANPDAVQKIQSFLGRYVESEEYTNQKGEKAMELKELTIEQLKQDRPDLVNALCSEQIQSAKLEERNRISDVLKSCESFEAFGLKNKVMECVSQGKTKDEALSILKDCHYEQLKNKSNVTPGASNSNQVEDLSALTLKERCLAEWNKDAELRKEFGTMEAYKAFKAAESKNLVKIFGKK